MIKTKAKAMLEDQNSINNIEFEVNYDKDRRDLIRVTLANKISVIKKDDLWNFVFSIVQTSQQQRMMPVLKTEYESYVKQHTVELQKDMKKGEIMAVNCKVNVRAEVAEALRRDIEAEKELRQESVPTPYLTDK